MDHTERQSIYRWFSPHMWYALAAVLAVFAPVTAQSSSNVVVQWNNAALQGVRDWTLGPPMVARALAIVHTCMYDAWAVYDQKATGTQLGGSLRTDPAVRTHANTPASAVTLHWKTFHDAADQAGISRRYGGIHFRAADLVGRATGNMAAMNSWAKSLTYFDGRMERER